MDLQSTVTLAVNWVVVPVVLVAIFCYGLVIATAPSKNPAASSRGYGFWAGVVLFAVFVYSQLKSVCALYLTLRSFPVVNYLAVLLLILVGFGAMWLLRLALQTRLIGIAIFFLIAASLVALFSYIFLPANRQAIAISALAL